MVRSNTTGLVEDDLTGRYAPKTEATPGNFIRAWRLHRNFKSHGELADHTVTVDPEGRGINRVTISRLESGITRYNQSQLELLGKALDIPAGDLISRDPNKKPTIVEIYEAMNAAQKKQLEAVGAEMLQRGKRR